MHQQLSLLQAIIFGILQGLTELFPISSLGHSVILPHLMGWNSIIRAQNTKNSYFLAFLVGLHVATALGMFIYFRKDWFKIIKAVLTSLQTRSIDTPDARLGWLLIVATIPAGLMGLIFENLFRQLFAKPLAASIFLFINGLILVAGEQFRQRSELSSGGHSGRTNPYSTETTVRRLDDLEYKESGIIGVAQVFALLAGISRSGITMVAGLVRGLDHEDAARFSFLMATPIILAAGLYKLPLLLGHAGSGVRVQVVIGSIFALVTSYLSVRFLTRYFQTKNLYPFAAYCLALGSLLIIKFA
jgi:undecaprenyl-diphosphatase